jgi:pimeloyl-ACP methyl ester carboxylesterase
MELDSRNEFQLWLSRLKLQNYHILLPDLLRQGQSPHLDIPFDLPSISSHLADFITSHAKGGKADVVGWNFGGFVAPHLASKYPALVSSAFVTGCGQSYVSYAYSTWMAIKTYLGAVLGMVLIPRSWLLVLLES